VEADADFHAARDKVTSSRVARTCATEESIAWSAVRKGRAFSVSHLEAGHDLWLVAHHASAALAAPVLVSGQVIGAVVYIKTEHGAVFEHETVAKLGVLVSQLGTAVEALCLNQLSSEAQRQATILIDVASTLRGLADPAAVVERVAESIRAVLHSPATLAFNQQLGVFHLQAVSTDGPRLAHDIIDRFERNDLRSALEIARRAVAAGDRITVSIDRSSHFGEDSPPGVLVAVPFSTALSQGAILVYPRADNPYTQADKTLISALASLGAGATNNAEWYGVGLLKAHELHEIPEISIELGYAAKLDQSMQTAVIRAASLVGFKRCFIALLEKGTYRVRWTAENDAAHAVDIPMHDFAATGIIDEKNVFVTENATYTSANAPNGKADFIAALNIRQLLAVPLLDSNGEVLGMFAALDRIKPGTIDDQDVARARVLAAQVSVALDLARRLHQSEEDRHRAELLTTLAIELYKLQDPAEFMRTLAECAAGLLRAHSVAMSLFRSGELDAVLLTGFPAGRSNAAQDYAEIKDQPTLRRLSQAMSTALTKYTTDIAFDTAGEMLGGALASGLGWTDCTLLRLCGSLGEVVGVLCIADRGSLPRQEDQQLMRAIAGHANAVLENTSRFARTEKANRHWLEVFDAIGDFIVVHDEQYNIIRVNRALADFIGLSPDQLIGVNMRGLDDLSTATSPHSCPFCRSGEGPDEYVHPILERTYLISTSRIHGDGSGQLETVHVLKDVTDGREAERRYRELFDNIQEGIYVSTPQGRFVEVNDTLVRILGYSSREEVLQLDIPSQVYFSPERRNDLAERLKRGGEMRNHEEVLRRKDGSPVHVFMNCFAMRDHAGNVLQHRGLMLDVSGLHQSQTELQKERDFSSKILSHTQSLILVTDTEGFISYANRRWSGLGFQQNQIIGHTFADLCAPPRRGALREAMASVARGQQVDNFDLPLLRGDGVSAQFSVNLSPISGEDGRVSSIVVVMSDVTDSSMLRAKLVHAEKMAAVGQLVSGVAHEVNNPLTAILGFTDLLMENPDLPESARRDLRVILQEAQRTKQIVQNLLSFARQMPPQRKQIQLNPILQRTVHLRSYDFISHGVQVVERLDEALPHVVGDSHQLQQVFLNILNNAYDAVRETSRPARIEISSAAADSFVEISFRDNGPGIVDPERIFDPFFTTKDIGKGTGLGLSICYGIVREHGGEIACHNNLDSEGATFVVRLPVASESASFEAVAGVNPK
jgi:two-component system NtrC family sensor kinase